MVPPPYPFADTPWSLNDSPMTAKAAPYVLGRVDHFADVPRRAVVMRSSVGAVLGLCGEVKDPDLPLPKVEEGLMLSSLKTAAAAAAAALSPSPPSPPPPAPLVLLERNSSFHPPLPRVTLILRLGGLSSTHPLTPMDRAEAAPKPALARSPLCREGERMVTPGSPAEAVEPPSKEVFTDTRPEGWEWRGVGLE